MVINALVTAFISMFCVFVTAPHSCGAIFYARALTELKYKILTI